MSPYRKSLEFIRRRDGAAAAEMALVVPVLALVLFGTAEFGRLFQNYNVVAKGVRDGARYLARLEANDCSGGAWTAKSGTAVADTQNLTTTGVLSGGTPLLPNFDTGDVSVTQSCIAKPSGIAGIYGSSSTVRLAVVVATITHTFMLGDYVLPGVPTLNFVVTHREPHIGE